jgi:hypothetical protein
MLFSNPSFWVRSHTAPLANIRASEREKERQTARSISSRYAPPDPETEQALAAIEDDVHTPPENEEIGRALELKEASGLLEACFKSNQPSLYPAIVQHWAPQCRASPSILEAGEFSAGGISGRQVENGGRHGAYYPAQQNRDGSIHRLEGSLAECPAE